MNYEWDHNLLLESIDDLPLPDDDVLFDIQTTATPCKYPLPAPACLLRPIKSNQTTPSEWFQFQHAKGVWTVSHGADIKPTIRMRTRREKWSPYVPERFSGTTTYQVQVEVMSHCEYLFAELYLCGSNESIVHTNLKSLMTPSLENPGYHIAVLAVKLDTKKYSFFNASHIFNFLSVVVRQNSADGKPIARCDSSYFRLYARKPNTSKTIGKKRKIEDVEKLEVEDIEKEDDTTKLFSTFLKRFGECEESEQLDYVRMLNLLIGK